MKPMTAISSIKMQRLPSTSRQSSLPDGFHAADLSRGETYIIATLEKLVETQAQTHDLVADISKSLQGASLASPPILSGSRQLSKLSGRSTQNGEAETAEVAQHPLNFAAVRHSINGELLTPDMSSAPLGVSANGPQAHLTRLAPPNALARALVEVPEQEESKGLRAPRRSLGPKPNQFEHFSSESADSNTGDEDDAHPRKSVAPLLTRNWPKDLSPLQISSADGGSPTRGGAGAVDFSQSNTLVAQGSRMLEEFATDDLADWELWLQDYIVLDPNSKLHMLYDLLSLCVLFYDLTVIPFLLAWDMPFDEGILDVISITTVVFWTVDILVNMITAVPEDGLIQRSPRKIFRHYWRTWLILDLTIVISDWVSLLLSRVFSASSSSGSVKILRLAKMSRLVRILAMVRILKFVRVMEDFLDRTAAEGYRLAIKIISILVVIAWVTHMISCAWFAVGRLAPTDTGLHWTDSMSFFDIREEDAVYQYFSSLHWSVAQVTLGSMGVNPLNSLEHSFNVVCLIFGLLFGSTLISSLSATMVQFQMLRNGRAQKLQMLRKFLQDHKVDLHVSYLVQRQIQDRLGPKDKLSDKDVPELNLLSASLFADLQLEIFRPHVCQHSLFNLWLRMDAGRFKRFCVEALRFEIMRSSDELFQAGVTAASVAYVLVEGNLKYEQDPSTSPTKGVMVRNILPGNMLCEAALWSEWIHVGKAMASMVCRVLWIDGDSLVESLKMNGIMGSIVQQYAQQFHRRIISASPPRADYPSDMLIPYTDFEDLVISMEVECQTAIGLNALSDFFTDARRFRGNRAGLVELRSEVETGKSVVVVNGQGEVQRIVSVVALQVRDDNDNIFVQLGKVEKNKVVFKGELPGSKQQRGELTSEAVQRVLEQRLAPVTSCIELGESTRSREQKDSTKFGVKTKYLRTVCTSFARRPFEVPIVNTADIEPVEPPAPAASHNLMVASALLGGKLRAPGPEAMRIHSSDTAPRITLTARRIFLIDEGGTTCFYAWLTDEEFRWVSVSEEAILACLEKVWEYEKSRSVAAVRTESKTGSIDEEGNFDIDEEPLNQEDTQTFDM
mmetsp:Transcript_21363/g.49666  ORF Transcript_21363/g.49666 Transcript_21363/m.49666 type:complete len:1070 (-) Transcript_21363:28-3237(-)|eukprot:CAMPEP_0178391960 /NCGR_PEP_ID=MMETSP0689_2-20121128/11434_1 /TAXON_ID=160604 /ORGANISM="Amphidinium massartii, Strain CS-259" /LENGTH=1069 /DNA_ID=CAMNT_0020012523 /DNA_START=77 /DNA_END=3286 /DNA_ORIENTATION=+